MKRLSLQLVVAVCLIAVGCDRCGTKPHFLECEGLDGVQTDHPGTCATSGDDEDGVTIPPLVACESADLTLVASFTERLDVSATTPRIGSYTPLHRQPPGSASREGAPRAASATAKANPSGVTPLHFAAEAGNVAVVTALLDAGADVNATEAEWAQTPLIFAAAANRSEVIKLLVARGAKVNETSKALDVPKQQQTDRQAMTIQRQVLAASVAKGEEPTLSQQQAAIQPSVSSRDRQGAGATGRSAARGGRRMAADAAAQPHRAGRSCSRCRAPARRWCSPAGLAGRGR